MRYSLKVIGKTESTLEKCIGINKMKTNDRIEGTNTHSLGLWSNRTKSTRKLMAKHLWKITFAFSFRHFNWIFLGLLQSAINTTTKNTINWELKKILLCDFCCYPKFPNPTRPTWLWIVDCRRETIIVLCQIHCSLQRWTQKVSNVRVHNVNERTKWLLRLDAQNEPTQPIILHVTRENCDTISENGAWSWAPIDIYLWI